MLDPLLDESVLEQREREQDTRWEQAFYAAEALCHSFDAAPCGSINRILGRIRSWMARIALYEFRPHLCEEKSR